MHSRVTRVPLLALTIGAITILAAGCAATGGSASGGAKPAAPVSPAKAVELAANNSRAVNSLAASIDIQGTTSNGDVHLEGTLQEQIHPSLLTQMDLTSISLGGQLVPGGLSEIVTPTALYIRFPELMQAQHINKPWAELSLSALGAAGSSLSSLFSQVGSNSPVGQVQLLAKSKDVKEVGTGVISGVPVTEYSGTYSLSQALAALPASERAALGSAASASGIGAVKFSIWLDARQLPRKIVATDSGSGNLEIVTETITSYNQPVNIQLPTPGETYVVPASQLGG